MINHNQCENIMQKKQSQSHRRLQFDGMFDIPTQDNSGSNNLRGGQNGRKKRGRGGRGGRRGPRKPNENEVDGDEHEDDTGNLLKKSSEEIMMNSDRYNLWWTGPPESDIFKPSPWGAMHTETNNAIFTMAVIQGMRSEDQLVKSPNDLLLFLGSARKYFNGDIVIAIEGGNSMTNEMKSILKYYNTIVYEIPETLCSKATDNIFCGSEDERAPASVFRYYFYEKWASNYNDKSLILLSDFRDIIFQSNPFIYHTNDWLPDYSLIFFQEFYPNMVIERCRFNKKIMRECYGNESLRKYGPKVIISSGAAMGTKDSIIIWSHKMTSQLQEAPGRLIDNGRCTTGGIDHSFINWLIHGNKLITSGIKIKVYMQGEGAMNSLGGLKPDTVNANMTGNIGMSYWKILDNSGNILNWNGEKSPVVHQLEHFFDEMNDIVDIKKYENDGIDKEWQAISSTRCLWGCKSSVKYN